MRNNKNNYACPVVLITGSFRGSDDPLSSAEVWSPTGLTCNITDMTKGRKFHVQFTDGEFVTVCGGQNDNTCETLKNGWWRPSHTLKQNRSSSSVWKTGDATYIMGGWDSSARTTTEKIGNDGSVEAGFALQHDTRPGTLVLILLFNFIYLEELVQLVWMMSML